jgi:hypothetical protein
MAAMVEGEPKWPSRQNGASRRPHGRDNFHRLFMGACRATEVLCGQISQREAGLSAVLGTFATLEEAVAFLESTKGLSSQR